MDTNNAKNNNNEDYLMTMHEYFNSDKFWTKVDDWIPREEEKIFRENKNAIYLPVSQFYGVEPNLSFDSFVMNPKRCYNTQPVRSHICHYVNYFERFYDTDHELLLYYYRMKFLIDYGYTDENGNTRPYTISDFYYDIKRYILSESIYAKVWKMNIDNFNLVLNYKNKTNAGLQYTELHGKYLMEISFMMNVLIPLMMHFIYRNRILNNKNIESVILTVYNWLFERYTNVELMNKIGLEPADMFSKLYETTNTTMIRSFINDPILWEMCVIRGMDPTINSLEAVNTLIVQVMPKYNYNQNIVMYNFTSISNTIRYNVSDIAYEYDFVSLSSSKREGEDNASQFDKFEAHLIRQDEALCLQNKYNSRWTMNFIEQKFGPFDDDEINFMIKELTKDGKSLFNKFQQKLIFSLFYKYFGDTRGPYSINMRDYIVLMLSAKRMLIGHGMTILPYIISSNVNKIITRSGLNKKEMVKLEGSEYYDIMVKKYKNPKIVKQVLTSISIMIASDFDVAEYNSDLNGKKITVIPDLIVNEFLMYTTLI